MYHWKYLRKYRSPKGKHSWVYVYANKDAHKEISQRVKEAEDADARFHNALGDHHSDDLLSSLKEQDYRADLAQEYINMYSDNLISDIANWIYDRKR